MFRLISTISIASLIAVAGCEKATPTPGPAAGTTTASNWVLTSAPADAVPVGEAKSSVSEGDEVVIRGRIGGRVQPIAADSSVFTIVDMKLKHCGQLHGDTCPQPWDYCCEPPASLTAHSATVQLVNADGAALETDPIKAGLKALDEVIVVGTIGPRPNDKVLTIKATGVYRVGGE